MSGVRGPLTPLTESALHEQIVGFLAYALPESALVHHSPNEGKRGPRAQGELKRSGCLKGFPDLLILWNGNSYFLELKRPGGKLTPEQKVLLNTLNDMGFRAAVANSLELAEAYLRQWGIPLRSRPLGRASA